MCVLRGGSESQVLGLGGNAVGIDYGERFEMLISRKTMSGNWGEAPEQLEMVVIGESREFVGCACLCSLE